MATEALQPINENVWSARHARHLLSRACFGLPRAQVETLAAMTPRDAVDWILNSDNGLDTGDPDFLIPPIAPRISSAILEDMPERRRPIVEEAGRELDRQNRGLLKAWWLHRMGTAANPFRENMTLFWHGHFAVSDKKVESSWHNYQLNAVFREHALGNLKDLTLAVAKSPAMLLYLDNAGSRKEAANENWARELLELFTLGPGHYTERDIKAAARAFTGWTHDYKQFRYRSGWHDDGPKRFLGTRVDTGEDVLNAIYASDQASRFIAAKLWTYFAYPIPDPEIVDGVAHVMRENDYELKPVLEAMFLSGAFYSNRAIGTKIKSPVHHVVKLAHDLQIDPMPLRAMVEGSTRLGQELFAPPDVSGWEGGAAWIDTNRLMLRYNLPLAFVNETQDGAMDELNGMIDPNTMSDMGMVPMDGPAHRLLSNVPSRHREELKTLIGLDDPKYMAWIRRYARDVRGRRTWNGRHVFRRLNFDSADRCVEALCAYALEVDASDELKSTLYEALGNPRGSLRHSDLNDAQMNAMLHLMTSSAEYQLC